MAGLLLLLSVWIQKELTMFFVTLPGYLNYYRMRDRLPFFTLLFYLASFVTKKKIVWKALSMYFVSVAGILGLASIYFNFIGVGNTMLTGFIWRYAAPLQYSMQIIVITYLAHRGSGDITYSAALAYHATSATGYIYEIPFWVFSVKESAYLLHSNSSNLFFISYQIIAVPLFVWLLSVKGVRINRERFSYFVYAFFATYVMASKLYILESVWFARIPLIAYTIYLATTIRENNKSVPALVSLDQE